MAASRQLRRGLAAATLVLAAAGAAEAQQQPATDPRDAWAVDEGLSLHVDATGFSMPSGIAVVPNPGSGPRDPRYFVAELHGTVKVVTNDRTVHTFATDFTGYRAPAELPAMEGESGLAGICLDPARGYVFVTFVYRDSAGLLRNDIARFSSTPRTFSLTPSAVTRFTPLLAPWESFISHQVGSCEVSGGNLFVTVGDGRQTARSQDTTALLGKLLRLTVDGRPAPGGPFSGAGSAVWAYGLRNPFGMTIVDGQPYIAGNGSGIDRFLRIERGRNYRWDGTDKSIAIGAEVVITPSVGPAHLTYAGPGADALPESLRPAFFTALSAPRHPGVLRIPYDAEQGEPLGVPRDIVRYRGEGAQIVAAIAMAPDGLLFAPMLPGESGTSPVLRLAHEPGKAHPHVILENIDAAALLESKGCRGCHQLGGTGGGVGPVLDRDSLVPRLEARLASDDYRRKLLAMDTLDREPFAQYRDARAAILGADGHERLLLWTRYKLLEPRFENPHSGMPVPGLTEAQATLLAQELVGANAPDSADAEDGGIVAAVWSLVPRPPRVRHLAMFGLLGFVAGVGSAVGFSRIRRYRHRSPAPGRTFP